MSDDANLFEEWDENFLDEVIHVSELASSSTNPTQRQPQSLPVPSPHRTVHCGDISYSPPRELSQRVRDDTSKDFDPPFSGLDHNVLASVSHICQSRPWKEEGNERLKNASNPSVFVNSELWLQREPGRALKQFIQRDQGCLQLPKGDKKKGPLKHNFLQPELRDADSQCRNCKNLELEAYAQDHSQITLGCQNGNSLNYQAGSGIYGGGVASTNKSIGVQTDKPETSTNLSSKQDISTSQSHRNKLLAVWDTPTPLGPQRNLVSELLVACDTDLGILFGYLSFASKAMISSLADERSDESLQHQKPPAQSAEAEKVFHLYSTLTKIGSGIVKLDALFEALVDLCSLENDVILHRSLRVLHMTLNHTFYLDARTHKRDNVLVEGPASGNNATETLEFGWAQISSLFLKDTNEFPDSSLFTLGMGLRDAGNIYKKESRRHAYPFSTSRLDWISVFELMHQIAMRNSVECVRLEAVSIMNTILIKSNAYSEREKFGKVLGFQSVSHLLRKDSGLAVQKQAVHLLYLLLNCPPLMAMFCSGCKEEVERAGAVISDAKNASAVKGFNAILEGLAGCVACSGSGTQELELRRNAIYLLAFLASSGKLGFEILFCYRLLKRTNYLALILQMLISEMDEEVLNFSQPPEIFRERTLLIREALILLNRLVSSPQYATPVLRGLTSSREMACLTVDIANRLSCKGKWLWQSDSVTKQVRETEIVELARVFKKRVYTFLGNALP